MSFMFGLKYRMGLIPGAEKFDSRWAKLLKMRDDLHRIEASDELARFHELDQLIHSSEFQQRKQEILEAKFVGSPEERQLKERAAIAGSRPVKRYFATKNSAKLSRFLSIKEGDKPAQYDELVDILSSESFVRNRNEVQGLSYKTSPEYAKRREFTALKKHKGLKKYYQTIASEQYRAFLEMDAVESPDEHDPRTKGYRKFIHSAEYENVKSIEAKGLPEKFEALKQEISNEAFMEQERYLKDKKRYRGTEQYRQEQVFLALRKDADMRFYHKFLKSSEYQNFVRVSDSDELHRLNELNEVVEHADFKAQVIWLKDKRRYQQTDEYRLEREHIDLKNSPSLKRYAELQQAKALEFFKHWNIVFDDEFSDGTSFDERWRSHHYLSEKLLGSSVSQFGELQAYIGKENISLRNNMLTLITKSEKTEGKIWNPMVGLQPHTFDYSSAMVNTGGLFSMASGVVEAKIRFKPNDAMTFAFSLTGEKAFPQIDLFRSGKKKLAMGVVTSGDDGAMDNHFQFAGISYNHFHIYRLEWTENSLVWKINGETVHQQAFSIPKEPMFLNFVASVHNPVNGRVLPHHFEIDWVRCYQKK